VRGGAPGTINTDALRAGGLIQKVDGVVLSGGSVFGLEAATGLVGWLAARGRGFAGLGPCLPIVTGAILFDLLNGGEKGWGNTASALDAATGITVSALVAANPVGPVTMPGSGTMWAWHLEQAGELGGQAAPRDATGHAFETKRGIGMNTTIGVVATDAALDYGALQRLAAMAQGGYAYAIRLIHTPFDGDAVFALATGAVPLPDKPDALVRLGAIAADVVARAVMRSVYEAETLGESVAYRRTWSRPPTAAARGC